MCQQTTYRHNCTHKVKTPLLLCNLSVLPSFLHTVNKPKVVLPFPCPTCAARLGQPIIYPYQVTTAIPAIQVIARPQSQLIYRIPQPQPQFIYQQIQPRIQAYQQTPGPGSNGTPLPVASTVPRQVRQERVGSRWENVVHYGVPSPSPAANARPANIPADRGWSQVHGLDPGPPPPGPQPDGNGRDGNAVDDGGNSGGGSGSGPPASIVSDAVSQAPLTPNVEARNVRNAIAESLIAMDRSELERLTAANTEANANRNGNANVNLSTSADRNGGWGGL